MMNQQSQQPDYINLLSGLNQVDGDVRKRAEEMYNGIPVKDRFSILGAALCNKETPESFRIFAAVLLRRLILNSWADIQSSIAPEQLQPSCNELLNVVKNSINDSKEIREKLCQVVGVLGKSFLDEATQVSRWTDFIQFIFELLRSPETKLRECGFTIFANNPEVLGQINGETAYLNEVQQCFMESISVKGQPDTYYVSLVSAISALIISNSASKESVKKLSAFANPLVGIWRQIGEESFKEEVCQRLIETAEEAPLSLRPAITQIIQECLFLTSNLESDIRFSALELVVTLIENGPVMIKKRAPQFIKPVVLCALNFMSSIEDDPDWYTSCSNEKDGDEPDAIGELALDRISNAIGGKILLPILIDELTAMLRKPEWQSRHAALMAFSCAGEGCKDQLMRCLDRIVAGILNFLNDPHPRVRHAACNCIGQMATDFSPDFETKFHSQVIPSLCRLLMDFSNVRVQAHSACAMINFYEECPKEILENYLDPVTDHIKGALSGHMTLGIPNHESKIFVIENIIVALSSVADTSEELFNKYYDKFIPCLKFIIKETTGKEKLRVLRGKAIECISLIGVAVGKEKFMADASDVMQMLLATQTGELQLADDDPQLSYMMAAWARICRILGPGFEAYLPYVMEPVLKAAASKVDIALLDDEDKAALENNNDWQSFTVQDQAVGIRTSGLEDKATACSMLVCYARELKHGFADYVERTAEILIPLLKFIFHDDVRCAAAEALPYLLECAKPKGDQCVMLLWNAMFTSLMESFDLDSEASVMTQIMDSLSSCIEIVGITSMTPVRHEQLVNKLNDKFKFHFEYLAEEFERRKDEDYETESDCSDDDQDCLAGIAGIIHSLFVVYKADYLPYFQALIEPIMRLCVNDASIPWCNKQTAICIWDDVIEYTGQNCVNYRELYLPLLMNGIQDKNHAIRQAALYGIGQLAQHNGPMFIDFFQTVIPMIIQLINHPDARSEDCIEATENGISTMARILRNCPQVANHSDLVKCWVDWLPIWEDEAEVPIVMDYLLQLIEQNHPSVMGLNSTNLPRLVAIAAEVFARSLLDVKTEVGSRLANFLKQVHANPTVSSCLSTLTITQQKAVQEVLSI